jgi:hypothetical protein
VLNLVSNEKRVKRARDFSVGVSSEYYEIKTGHGPLHVHIDYDEDGPFRLSASIEPVGTEMSGLASLTGILITQYLEQGGNPNQLLKHLNSIKGDRPLGIGDNKVNSISHAIAIALKNHLKKHGWLETKTDGEELLSVHSPTSADTDNGASLELWSLAHSGDQCPRCFSSNISFNTGCSGPLCQDCGYSECS